MEVTLGIITIIVIVVPLVLGVLHARDYRNIAEKYWEREKEHDT